MLVVLAACAEQSRVDPEAAITVSGRAQDVDGSPLTDRAVRLGSGITEGEVGLAILTVGVSCMSGSCRGDFYDTSASADGSYRFELRGRDTQSSFGEALSFLASTSAPPSDGHPSGAAASARFRIQSEVVKLPALRLVDPALAVDGNGAEITARWRAGAAPGPYTVTFEEAAAVPVWAEATGAGELPVDARVLEDTAGQVVVSGTRTDATEGSDVVLEWRSPSVGYAGGLGAPPSRGRPCTVMAGDGSSAPGPGCRLTDGDLQSGGVEPFVCTSAENRECPPTAWARVELGGPVPAEVVVVRGCSASCMVRAVTEGAAGPHDVGAVSGEFGLLRLDGTPVTAVDVAVGDHPLREVSVWGPAPARPPLAPAGDEALAPFADSLAGQGGDDDGPPAGLLAVAATLVAAVAGAGGYVLARRRDRSQAGPAATSP